MVNISRFSFIFVAIFAIGCNEDVDTSNMEVISGEGYTNVRGTLDKNYSAEETVTSEPVYINDKKLDPPPSPVSRLRTNFGGRQKQYAPMINRISRQYGVDPLLTHSIISQESWYRPTVGSHAGAVGLMQLIESAGRRYGCVSRKNPQCNVKAGVKYLKALAKRYAGRGNIQTIASGYNAGEAVADSYLSGRKLSGKNPLGRRTPNGVPVASFGYSSKQRSQCDGRNSMPGYKCEGETYHYARNVAGYYLRYRQNPKLVGLGGSLKRSPSSEAARRGKL